MSSREHFPKQRTHVQALPKLLQPKYGVRGTIRTAELNGLVGVTCKTPPGKSLVRDKLWIRILSEGPHRGDEVLVPVLSFVADRPRPKKKFIGAPPPRSESILRKRIKVVAR